jgi:DNA-binding PadR family transcriptional regulator
MLPTINHTKIFVLVQLSSGPKSELIIRKTLVEQGWIKTPQALYQMLYSMAKAGLIKDDPAGYRITDLGSFELNSICKHYKGLCHASSENSPSSSLNSSQNSRQLCQVPTDQGSI